MAMVTKRNTAKNTSYISNSQILRKHRPDYVILILSLILLSAGLVVMYSISPALAAQGGNVSENYFVIRQFVAIIMGLAAFFVASRIPFDFWLKYQKPLIITAILLSLATVATGGMASRWLQFGFFSFQPVEFVKFILIILLSGFLANLAITGELTSFKRLKPLIIISSVLAFIIVALQRDLGSTMVLCTIMLGIAFVAGFPMKKLFIVGILVVVLAVMAISSTAYRRERLMTFLAPERDCVDKGWHACQALIAVGSGGLTGLGLGRSVQAYGYLPEAENDSIFAIFAEKFGFIGVVILIGLIGTLLTRILNIMQRVPNRYMQLVCVGVFTWLSVQAVFNIASMVGLMPLKGITLPFVSYGGTSLIFAMAGLGLVFQASYYTTMRKVNLSNNDPKGGSGENISNRRRDSRPHYTVTRRSI